MALRVFRCEDCGHKMRYNAEFCGNCGYPASPKNLLKSILIPVLVVAALFFGVGILV